MNQPSPLTAWWLRGLHLLLALATPLILIALLSCYRAKEKEADLGPEFPSEKVFETLGKAVQRADFNYLSVDDFIKYVTTRRLENQEIVTLMGDLSVKVVARLEDKPEKGQVTFMLLIERNTRQMDDTFEHIRTEEPLVLSYVDSDALSLTSALAKALAAKMVAVKSLAAAHVRQADKARVGAKEAKVIRQSFHNLREWSESVDPPPAVAQRPGCGGLSPCQLSVNYVQFDLVNWYDDDTHLVINLDWGVNNSLPFLPFGKDFDQFTGLFSLSCQSALIPVTDRTVYVRDCLNVEDFQK